MSYVGLFDLLGFTCDAREKAALMEFPQYGGKVIGEDIKGPLGGEALNIPSLQAPPPGCELAFTARQASLDQVSTFYEKTLIEHGWTVKRVPVDRKGELEYPHVDGTRDGFHYDVHYWSAGLQSSAPADWSSAARSRGTQRRTSSCTVTARSQDVVTGARRCSCQGRIATAIPRV